MQLELTEEENMENMENMEDKKMNVVWVGTFAAGLMIENNISKEENSGFESDQNL